MALFNVPVGDIKFRESVCRQQVSVLVKTQRVSLMVSSFSGNTQSSF